jgi:hypothetical protein
MRVLVCGGRDYNDRKYFISFLDKLCEERGWKTPEDEYGNWLPAITIIHGGARGADSMADDYAIVNWTGLKVYPAQWAKYGKKAGYIRNQKMLDEGKPNVVVAFPGGKGTQMMKDLARKAGVEVIEA